LVELVVEFNPAKDEELNPVRIVVLSCGNILLLLLLEPFRPPRRGKVVGKQAAGAITRMVPYEVLSRGGGKIMGGCGVEFEEVA
jgi:hypothetical protein